MKASGISFSASTTKFVHTFVRNNEKQADSIEQLSTGKRINRPADDPAGFVAAEQIRGELIELRGERKVDVYRRVDVRQQQSALSNIQTTLINVRANVVTAADGTLDPNQRAAIQQEVDESLDAIDRIAGQVPLAEFSQPTSVEGSEGMTPLRTGGRANLLDGDADQAINIVDGNLESVTSQRAALGAVEHTQLDVFEQLRQDKEVILTETLSQIEDTDFAAATAQLVQSQILSQASMAALAYASQQMTDQMQGLMETIDVTAE